VLQRTEEMNDPGKATALTFTTSHLGTEVRHMRTIAELVLVEDEHRVPVLKILTGASDWWSDLFGKIKLA
jgi:hypothetical protein